ncbi:alanine racemase, partial [Streptococcus anginosus]|nr:alanine racemase [Streptococcus anginosus]
LRKYPAQALVRLDVLAHNMAHMVEMTAEHARVAGVEAPQIMGVVKADAYGHGLIPSALAALSGGATWLGVAQAREALALRCAGIDKSRA